MNPKSILKLVLMVVVGCPIPGCATLGGSIEGVVIDRSTNQPIPNAFVAAQWDIQGSAAGVHSRSACIGLEVVKADSNGRYRLSTPTFIGAYRQVISYAKGYAWVNESGSDQVMAMRRFIGSDEQMMESHRAYRSLLGCGPPEEAISKLEPLFSAIDEEEATLRISPLLGSPGGFVRSLRELAESLARERARQQVKGGGK